MSNKKNANKNNNEVNVLKTIPVIVNHKGIDVELTKDNISSIYNTNYINSFIDKINDMIDEDITLDIEIISKYDIFIQYKLQSLERKKERLINNDKKDKLSIVMNSLTEEQVNELYKKHSK